MTGQRTGRRGWTLGEVEDAAGQRGAWLALRAGAGEEPHAAPGPVPHEVDTNGDGFEEVTDLTGLASRPAVGFVIQGDADSDHAGTSVSLAGDINGDGFDDLIVGAPNPDGGGYNAGAAYVIFGKAGGFGTIDLANLGGAGFAILGDDPSEGAGTSVSSAGDINGDGYDDLIIGAPYNSDGGGHAGKAYVVFGKTSGFGTIDLANLGAAGFTIQGAAALDRAGTSVSSAGDVNGDGLGDLIVGAPFSNGGNGGDAYVIFGKATGFGTIDLANLGSAGFIIHGVGNEETGYSVSSAGDVNGDGFDDLIVGEPYHGSFAVFPGRAYVIFGKASAFGTVDLANLGTAGFVIEGKPDTYAGLSVSSAGDINGDGFDEVIVGAPLANEAYVVFGKAGGFGTVDLANLGAAGFTILGDTGGDRAGISVSAAGDVNGDGFDDIILGAPFGDDGGNGAGEAYVIFGKAGGFGTTIDLTGLASRPDEGFIIQGDTGGDLAGESVAGAGDVNGDGFDDLIVGATYGDDGGDAAGAAYVIFGQAPTVAVVRTGSVIGQTIRGGAFDDRLDGREGDDRLVGDAGNDLLIGGIGADRMEGGAGDDTYFVDQAGDVIVETAGSGRDVVYTAASYALAAGASVEVLAAESILATTAINIAGNAFNNEIYGNNGANMLFGGGGGDYLVGWGGDDTYFIQSGGEIIVEDLNGGRDVVYSAISYALANGTHVEVLAADSILATTAINLAGNSLNNEIYGNNGSNMLFGGGGAGDYLVGWGGDDTYFIQSGGELIVEFLSGGRDVVYTAMSYGLTAGAHVEVLAADSIAATTAIDLTGNELVNEVYGNNGANTLNGGAGSDYLAGWGGADNFAFTTALGSGNVDALADFSAADDTILLDNAVFNGLVDGALPAGAFAAGATAADLDDRIVYNSATGQIFFDADGSGVSAQILFATVTAGTVLTAGDFQVI